MHIDRDIHDALGCYGLNFGPEIGPDQLRNWPFFLCGRLNISGGNQKGNTSESLL